jgi:hypothetical protein
MVVRSANFSGEPSMSPYVLQRLRSDEFALSVGFLSTPGPLRRFLRQTEDVAAIRAALEQGAITDETLRAYVSSLMQDLRRGERFPHELAVAALAVALEMRPTEFAEEFLQDLSRLRLAEMSLCIRVARECLRHWTLIPRNTARHFDVGPRYLDIPFCVTPAPNGSRSNAANQMCKVGLCQP